MIEKTISNTTPATGGLRRSRLRLAIAIIAIAPTAALAPVATAAPISLLPGDLAVLYSVYPGLPNPNTGSIGGYTTPNITAGTTALPIRCEPPRSSTSCASAGCSSAPLVKQAMC